MFASGLIVDGLHAFDNDLWQARSTVVGHGLKLDPESSGDLLRRDWVRRANKYTKNYFGGDTQLMTDCLKDCFNLHKWKTIEREIKPIDFARELGEQQYTDINTMGAQACAGGACSIEF